MTALITGGTGQVGPALVAGCLARAPRVRVLARRAARDAFGGDPRVEWVEGDVADPAVAARAVDGVDTVFHLAAKVHASAMNADLERETWRVNRDGTETVWRAAARAGVSRFVFFSTIAVYGPGQGGAWLDESATPRPDTPYASSKLEAEAIALSTEGTIAGTVLRVAAVYGPGVKGNYQRLVRALERGYYVPIGDGRNRRTLVYQDDVAAAALLAASHPDAAGATFNVTDGGVHTVNEIVAAISAALGRRPPRVRVPAAPIAAGLGVVEAGFRLIGRRPPVGRATLAKLLEDVAIDGSRLRRTLGFTPSMTLEKGWRATVARDGGRG